jgi:xanthosine utilization system XapX-like protein
MTSGEKGPPQGPGQPAQPAPPPYGAPPAYSQPAQPPAGFGQYQQYGQPMSGADPVAPYQQPVAQRGVGITGIVFTAIGAALGVVAFTALDWGKTSPTKFSDLHHTVTALDRVGVATGIAKLYVGWLGWTLLAVAVVLAIAANLPSPASPALRIVGALAGLAGIGLTLWAIDLGHGPPYTEFLKNARVGFYVALGAFVFISLGAMIGPRRTS